MVVGRSKDTQITPFLSRKSDHLLKHQIIVHSLDDCKSEQFKKSWLSDTRAKLDYLERDEEKFCGKLTRLPLRAEIPVQINDQMVVEFYSK